MTYRLVSFLAAVSLCFAIPAAPVGLDAAQQGLKMSARRYGGDGGTAFDDGHSFKPHYTLRKVTLRGAKRLDRISFSFDQLGTLSHGGMGGRESTLILEGDDYIKTFTVCWEFAKGTIFKSSTLRIFYLQFVTRDNKSVEAGEKSTACDTRGPPAPGYRLIGALGSAGNEVDGLQFLYTHPGK